MRADHHITRNDDEAEKYDLAREEWISAQAAALEMVYSSDAKKVGEAVADFFLADDETLVPNLTAFCLLYGASPNGSAYILHEQLRAGIAPILREYAEDAARAEWDQMETAASAEAERAAA